MRKFSHIIQKMPSKARHVRIFTDGACFPNPGTIGGWAFIIINMLSKSEIKSAGHYVADGVTNNVMELMAVIKAIASLDGKHTIELVTDSEYVGKGIVYWMNTWAKNGWKQKNGLLWKELYELNKKHVIYVTCIKGHNGQPENEECDRMAGEQMKNKQRDIKNV